MDRRDEAARDALFNRLREELRHAPGLALTVEQAARLFDLPADVCGRLVAELAGQGAIYTRPDGRFVAAG
jgi:hypothetical protein